MEVILGDYREFLGNVISEIFKQSWEIAKVPENPDLDVLFINRDIYDLYIMCETMVMYGDTSIESIRYAVRLFLSGADFMKDYYDMLRIKDGDFSFFDKEDDDVEDDDKDNYEEKE